MAKSPLERGGPKARGVFYNKPKAQEDKSFPYNEYKIRIFFSHINNNTKQYNMSDLNQKPNMFSDIKAKDAQTQAELSDYNTEGNNLDSSVSSEAKVPLVRGETDRFRGSETPEQTPVAAKLASQKFDTKNLREKANQILKNKITWGIAAIVILGSLGGFLYFRSDGKFFGATTPTEVQVDMFILGGGLGGASAAIQATKDNNSFVLSEATNWLGGQATIQGVSTLDQNNKNFQKSGIYNEILENMKLNSVSTIGPYVGNATTGPGDLPASIDSYLKSRLSSYNKGKLLFNTQLESVDKVGETITSVTVRDRNELSKKYTVKAKYYLDSTDYSDLTRMAGIEYNFGLDSQEDTKERIALTQKEKDVLINGTTYAGAQVGGFGNLIQPITTPFAILDKGYVGNKINLNDVVPAQSLGLASTGSTFASCQIDKNKSCILINPNSKLEKNLDLNYLGKQHFTFIFEGKLTSADLQINVNNEATNLQPINEKINNADYTLFKIAYLKDTANFNFVVSSKKNSLSLSDIITTPFNFENLSSTENLADITAKADLNIGLDKLKFDEAKKTYTLNLNDYKGKLDPNKNYYILTTFPQKNNLTLSKNISAFVNESNKNVFAVNIDPVFDFNEEYLPTYKLKYDETKNQQFILTNNEAKEKSIASSIIIIDETKVGGFKLIKNKEGYAYTNSQFIDITYLGLQKNLKATKQVLNGDSIIFSNVINAEDKTPRLGQLGRTEVGNGDTLSLEDKENNSILILKNLNLEHYFDQIFNSFTSSKTRMEQTLAAGNYDIFIKTLNINKLEVDDKIDLKISYTGNNSVKRNIDLIPGKFEKLYSFTLQNPDNLQLEVISKCKSDCLKNVSILVTSSVPNNYDSGFLNRKISVDKDFLKPLYSSSEIGQDYFFKFRQILDPINVSRSNVLDVATKNIIATRGLGISQINTGFNDFYLKGIDTQKYISDEAYFNEINKNSKDYSARYYYWLKYDVPKNYLGCSNTEAFCASTRINISPIAMNTKDGFSELPYVRDPVRPVGKSMITYQDISLNENLCSSTDVASGKKCDELSITNTPNKLLVSSDFLQKFNKKPLFGYFYAADVHSILSTTDIKTFYDYLEANKLRNKNNLPKFLPGIYDTNVRPYSVGFDNIHSDEADNLLFCGKNISVSQIANGSTRLHPAESMAGQSCGVVVNFLIKNGDKKLNYLGIDSVYASFSQDLVKNNMYPIPFEDQEFIQLYADSKYDVLTSYFKATEDKILPAELVLNDRYQYAIYKFTPKRIATGAEVKTVFDAVSIKTTNFDTSKVSYTYKDLLDYTEDKNDDQKLSTVLNEYVYSLSTDTKLTGTRTITKGDLAYIYYKLGK